MIDLWLLERLGQTGFDEFDGFVIAAASEFEARQIANEQGGDQGPIWCEATLVKCTKIEPKEPGVILASFNAG